MANNIDVSDCVDAVKLCFVPKVDVASCRMIGSGTLLLSCERQKNQRNWHSNPRNLLETKPAKASETAG